MSFGYSAGDFIAGGNLIYQLIKALSGTQCPSEEYQEALKELGCFQHIFIQVGQMTENPNLGPATINAASHIVLSSMTLIGDFVAKTQTYRGRLNSWQNMGWVMFKADELKGLKDALHIKLTSISMLLNTAQIYDRTPIQVAALTIKQVESTPSLSPIQFPEGQISPSSPVERNPRAAHNFSVTEGHINNERLSKLKRFPRMGRLRGRGSVEKIDSRATSKSGITKHPPPPPPPPPSPQALPTWPQIKQVNSTRVVDITPRKALNEDACRIRLTNYLAHIIRKIESDDPAQKPTWAKTEINREALSDEDVSHAVKKLNGTSSTVHQKKASLDNFQQSQINRLMDSLMNEEKDSNFEWSIAQLDLTFKTSWMGQKELLAITVYAKRAPIKDINPVLLYSAIEKWKSDRLSMMAAESRRMHEAGQTQNWPPGQAGPPPPPPPPPPLQNLSSEAYSESEYSDSEDSTTSYEPEQYSTPDGSQAGDPPELHD